jgi:hypothetical protein
MRRFTRWPTRGVKVCPYYMHSTRCKWLKHNCKYCFMGHRRYLPMDHLWRLNKRTFDSNKKLECALDVLGGDEILRHLERMVFGDENASKSKPDGKSKMNGKKKRKKRKRTPKKQQLATDHVVWKKKSIFFRLLY